MGASMVGELSRTTNYATEKHAIADTAKGNPPFRNFCNVKNSGRGITFGILTSRKKRIMSR